MKYYHKVIMIITQKFKDYKTLYNPNCNNNLEKLNESKLKSWEEVRTQN